MEISVCGKGGSGKSTIVSLLANELEARGYRVMVVDSDESNSGLFRMLGFDKAPIPLMELAGGKRKVKRVMRSNFSSGEEEYQMNVLARKEVWIEDIPPEHILKKDNLRLVCVGKILQSLEGCACPMGVLSREFLKRLRLKTDEIAIVDMEAGVEHFGRGVETSIDTVLVIVEPSFESLELAIKVKRLAAEVGVKTTCAVLNKVSSDEIALRLEEELRKRGVEVKGVIHYDPEIFEACLEGGKLGGGRAGKEIREVVDRLLSVREG